MNPQPNQNLNLNLGLKPIAKIAKLNLIVAFAQNYVIGYQEAMPWYLPEDLKQFKEKTAGQIVIMGRKTYDSIVNFLGKPLPNRSIWVLSSKPMPIEQLNQTYTAQNTVIQQFFTLADLLKQLHNYCGAQSLWVIGGGQIYQALLPYCQNLYISHIAQSYKGDAYFPQINWQNAQIISEQYYPKNEANNAPAFNLVHYYFE